MIRWRLFLALCASAALGEGCAPSDAGPDGALSSGGLGFTRSARFLFAAGVTPPSQGPNNQFLGHVLAVQEEIGMTILRGAASKEEGRAAAREIAQKGIPFIKIWVDDRGGTQEKLRPDVYRAVLDEAAAHGKSSARSSEFAGPVGIETG